MAYPPVFSDIIPTLNEEKLAGAALSQFTADLVQRHGIELVVSDGGSTDETLSIARRHAHVVVENVAGTKQTIALGRNLGAEHASGGILVFMNADTRLCDPDRFFTAIGAAVRREDVAAVTCSVMVYPEEERPADRRFHTFYNWFFFMMNKVGMGMGRGECHVMRRGVFFRVKGYAGKIAAGEDYDMFRRLRRIGRILFLRDLVVFESPRRYRRYGYARVTASWFMNFLTVFFLRRSILNEWKPVR
jgi:glycosyltransferase involved in cell wall biosynthesis